MDSKNIFGIIIIMAGLFSVVVAFGSENCLPFQEDPCLLRKDGDFFAGLFLGLVMITAGGILMIRKKS